MNHATHLQNFVILFELKFSTFAKDNLFKKNGQQQSEENSNSN